MVEVKLKFLIVGMKKTGKSYFLQRLKYSDIEKLMKTYIHTIFPDFCMKLIIKGKNYI